jgi:hypothetical protein
MHACRILVQLWPNRRLKLYQNIWLDHLEKWKEAAYPNWLFSINSGYDEMLEDTGKDGKIKNPFSFTGTGLNI